MFFTLLVIALVLCVVRPGLDAVTVLSVFLPIADVLGSVSMLIGASSLGFIVIPFALVDIAVGMNQSSLTVRLIIFPVSCVLGAIFPNLDSFALAVAVRRPLAVVHSPIVHLVWTLVDELFRPVAILLVENKLAELGFGGLGDLIRKVRHFLKLADKSTANRKRLSFIVEFIATCDSISASVRNWGLGIYVVDGILVDFSLEVASITRLHLYDEPDVLLADFKCSVQQSSLTKLNSWVIIDLDSFGRIIEYLGVLIFRLVTATVLAVSHSCWLMF